MRGGGQTSSFRCVPLNEVMGVLETEQFAVSHMFHVFEEQYQTCQILGRRFFYLVWQIFSSCATKHPMFLFPPPLSSQESIYASSPRYSTDLLLSCKGHKISQIKWAFELLLDFQKSPSSDFIWRGMKDFLCFSLNYLAHFF